MNADPSGNLAVLAGEIFTNLRSALDYIAFQIYLKGGGEPDAKEAKSVAFPIVTEVERWDKAVTANVPYAWDEAVEKLKWCQPIVQLEQEVTALPALRASVRRTNIAASCCMRWVFSRSADSSRCETGPIIVLLMAQRGPVLTRNEPALLGSVFLTTDLKSGEEALMRMVGSGAGAVTP